MIKDGVKAIKWFTDNGIRTNCTLVFSAGQAILAAKAGAAYVSPFIGRIDDTGWDGMELIGQIANVFSVQGYKTEILAASIRNSNHIVRAAELGADVWQTVSATINLPAGRTLLRFMPAAGGLENDLAFDWIELAPAP